jgi:P27 family predicted phage terminase small subunit
MAPRRATTPPAPSGLSAEASELWRRTLAEFAFDAGADLTLLRELCATLDRLREVQAGIKAQGLTVTGSQGQPRLNPLLAHEDQLRRTLLAHVRALRLTASPEF